MKIDTTCAMWDTERLVLPARVLLGMALFVAMLSGCGTVQQEEASATTVRREFEECVRPACQEFADGTRQQARILRADIDHAMPQLRQSLKDLAEHLDGNLRRIHGTEAAESELSGKIKSDYQEIIRPLFELFLHGYSREVETLQRRLFVNVREPLALRREQANLKAPPVSTTAAGKALGSANLHISQSNVIL
ncbi:MAG: hypothetical protein HY360_25910 [Verrucomicrobia bacterium]|nr:hypothetical protein [Verrucomicrobiota bacterium]